MALSPIVLSCKWLRKMLCGMYVLFVGCVVVYKLENGN